MSDLHSSLLSSIDKQPLVEALAKVAGIDIPAAHVPEVITHLVIAAAMAQKVLAADLSPDHAVPAPVYSLPPLASLPEVPPRGEA